MEDTNFTWFACLPLEKLQRESLFVRGPFEESCETTRKVSHGEHIIAAARKAWKGDVHQLKEVCVSRVCGTMVNPCGWVLSIL